MKNVENKSFGKFLIIWAGELVSSIGSGLTAFALGVYVYQMTGTATSVALVILLAFLPSVLLSPIAGVLADRFDRRLMMIIGDGCSSFGLVFILLIMLTGEIALWQIYLGVMVSSVFVALLEPSYKATITDLLTEEQFSKASGLVQLAASSKYLLSPIIAGFLLSVTGLETILIIDISTIAVTVFAVMFVKKGMQVTKKEQERQKFLKDLAEGWNAVTEKKGVLFLIIIISIVTFFIGFVQTLSIPMMLSITDVKTLGIVESVSAMGMLVSSLIIGIFSITKKYTNELVIGLGFAGWFISLMGLTTNIFFIAGAFFLFFAALPFVNTSAEVLIRKTIANEKQGRAWGIIGIISQLGYIAAYCISGVLADYVFNPLLVEGGPLASTLGVVIGTGPSRGIGLLFIISGFMVIVLAVLIFKIKAIRALENNQLI
ncbi:MAG: macrolide transporter [Desulfitibacter sp. BRH_c19]|nr:MAG: macrolide transporter [Desulfitibacter sp. BRH_c19]